MNQRLPNSFRSGPDERGHFGKFGGRFVAETLMPLILDLEKAYAAAKADPAFQAEMNGYLKDYVGRPSPLYFAERLTEHLGGALAVQRHFRIRTHAVAEQHQRHATAMRHRTFHVLHGELRLQLDGVERVCRPGAVITIAPGVRHAFSSDDGAVFEEISSTHFVNDSFYTDASINQNPNRKTILRYWI